MKHRLIFRPEARTDLLRAALHYEEQKPGLGDRFVADLNKVLDRIAENPLQFPRVIQDAHCALLSKFPYKVYFRIGEGIAKVLAIIHQRRHPDVWLDRLES
jgi:plasmid stabilization system protein ParE